MELNGRPVETSDATKEIDSPKEQLGTIENNKDRPPRFSMLRSYSIADIFTLSNAACGTLSLFLCLNYIDLHKPIYLWLAFLMIPFAFIFDALDGWIARRRNASSLLGGDLDSLSDAVSFGVAPAVIGFTLGLRGIWDMLILIFFVVCGISRLARFNVTAEDLMDEATHKVKYFEGTPIPSSILIVMALAILAAYNMVGVGEFWGGMYRFMGGMFHPFSLIFLVSGSLMISTIRIPKL